MQLSVGHYNRYGRLYNHFGCGFIIVVHSKEFNLFMWLDNLTNSALDQNGHKIWMKSKLEFNEIENKGCNGRICMYVRR